MPILILRETGVIADGILEIGVLGNYMPEFDLASPIDDYFRSLKWGKICSAGKIGNGYENKKAFVEDCKLKSYKLLYVEEINFS